MKTIYLIRHAKSSWDDQTVEDHERPLNDRGRKDASKMAKYLSDIGIRPEITLCSTAKRTKETYSYFTPFFGGIPLSLIKRLYHAPVSVLEDEIRSIDNQYDAAFLVGHNNGVSDLVSIILSRNVDLPTCSFTQIEFPVDDWKDADLLKAKVVAAISPKELPA